MPQVGYWIEGGGWYDLNQDSQNYAKFESIGTDRVAHLRIDTDNWKLCVARGVQGWIWGIIALFFLNC